MPKAEGGSTAYPLQFQFDTMIDCQIRVLIAASEQRDEDNHLVDYVPLLKNEFQPIRFPAGLNQEYKQPLAEALDPTLYTYEQLTYDPSSSTYPIVIVIEPLGDDPKKKSPHRPRLQHFSNVRMNHTQSKLSKSKFSALE